MKIRHKLIINALTYLAIAMWLVYKELADIHPDLIPWLHLQF